MRRALVWIAVAGTLGASLMLIGCGDDDGDGDGSSTAAATKASGTAPTTPQSGGAEGSTPSGTKSASTISVIADDFKFDPDSFEVPNGTITIVLENEGEAQHTLNVFLDSSYAQPVSGANTGQVAPGDEGDFTFAVPAGASELYFQCENHPTQMQGEMSVVQ